MKIPSHEEFVVNIEKMTYGAQGLGFTDQGQAVFVEGTFPGDKALVKTLEEKKNFQRAQLIKLTQKSPIRKKSSCLISKECGGCQWQEAPYKQQIKWKQQFVIEALERIAGIKINSNFLFHKSPMELKYRAKTLLRGRITKDGRINLGFFKKKSRELISLNHCPVLSEHINSFIKSLDQVKLDATMQKFRIHIQELPIQRNNDDKNLIILLEQVEGSKKNILKLEEKIKSMKLVAWCSQMPTKKTKLPHFEYDKQEDLTWLTAPGCFQQINPSLNQLMRERVAKIVNNLGQEINILDLYCGSGNLSLLPLKNSHKVTGVEVNLPSILSAKKQVEQNNLKSGEYRSTTALKYLQKENFHPGSFGLILCDPPRQGMKDIIPYLIKLSAKNILYISCDPATLARDLKALSAHYQLIKLEAFDFFPQTYHIETLCLLERNCR